MLQILLASASKKFLKKCEKELYDRVINRISELSANPFPPDCKMVLGRSEKVFRVRVGDYRIQYIVFSDKKEILISDIDKRSRAYKE
ncbi:type II toxin-antitoxin system RelE/ParE family toxin [Candidatus Woesearchaeota archaeon]|nr:type II toxin-antitoxin system RelE/ParE family toxin [Candidatus Woesearchaeota archaeon]